MILTRILIQRPILATMMNLALVLFGLIGLTKLPVRELPDIDPPIISVTTIYPGANAQVVETEITERLEEAINNIEGIKTLRSESREGVSGISIEFDLSRDIDIAAQDVRDRVSRIRRSLPNDIREPIVSKQDSDAQPILWIALNSDRYSPLELTTLAERQIKPRFQEVPGVSSIIIGGEKRFAMRLWLDSEKMAARQVTVLDVQRALRQQNIELPSGRIENMDREMTIQTRGELKSSKEFNELIVRTSTTNRVLLKDIGRAEEGIQNYRTIARSAGKNCVFLGVVKQAKANTVNVAKSIKSELAAIQSTLPPTVEIRINYDSSIFVEKAIGEVWETLAIAFGLVVLIIFVFLRDFRSTIIPTIAIPISVIGTFAVMYLLGYSVNILTMLALVLVIGIVVDDAIVVLEAIYRHIEEGMTPLKASFKAMDEISFAVIAITLTLVAVFTPLAFQKSLTERLFIEFAVAISASAVLSAFVALTLAPALAARILKPISTKKSTGLFAFFETVLTTLTRGYLFSLRWALRHRFLTVLVTFATCALMVLAYRDLDQDFLPQEDKGRMYSFILTPNGSTSEFTDRQLLKAENIVASIPEVASYGAIVAPDFSGPGQASQGIIFVSFQDRSKRKRSVQQIVNGPGGVAQRFFTEVEGGFAIVNLPKAIEVSFNSSPFELVLQNQNLDTLSKTVQALSSQFGALTNDTGQTLLRNIRVSYEVDKPELQISVDRSRAAALGVSIEDISRTLQILFGGIDLSRFKMDGKEYDVITQLERKSRLTPQDLDKVFVRNTRGELIQLSSLITRKTGTAANAISHYGRLRSASITASPGGIPIGILVKKVEPLLTDLPAGTLYSWEGEAKNLSDSTGEIWWVMGLAGVIVYMTLAAQFESFIHPITVMIAIPLAAVGAFGLLWHLAFLGKTGMIPLIPAMNINLFSQIGLVLLVGLVTKNSILLVEYANQQTSKGIDPLNAMMEAGRVRLRAILMTACSTIVGILPIAIGFGAGAESRRPMGIAVIGGMLTSTFLTLFVVPVIYVLLDHIFHRKSTSTSNSAAALDSRINDALLIK